MDVLLWLCFASAVTGVTSGAGLLPDGPLNKSVGETVIFTTTWTPGKPFIIMTWTFGDTHIISSHVANITDPEYEDRITLFPFNGSLELRNLTLNDSGVYEVSISPTDGRPESGTTTLGVYEPVSSVTVFPKSADLVEFVSSVRLSCSSSGSSLSFLWLNGSSEVTQSDRVQLTDGGSNLTIVNVTRYDQGPFRCRVSNPVSNNISDAVNFDISYGPENINLILSPLEEFYAERSNISLMCSAVSKPSAQFMWFVNEDKLLHTGPELNLINIQVNQSGNYSCQAFNPKTERYQTSPPSAVTVLARVADVVVTTNTTDLVESVSSVRLSCSSSGSSLSFLWLNGSSEVTQSDRVQLTDGNSTLTIVNVTRYDQGPFRCRVFNPVSNNISDAVNFDISYGPENITLTLSSSQEYFAEGSNISLFCSAVSRPAALFQWFLNGDLQTDTGSELRLMNIEMSQSGNYSCQAFNNRTMRSQTSQETAVSVLEKIKTASLLPSTKLPVEGTSVNLTCEASSSMLTRQWQRNGSDLIPTDNMTFSDNDRVLSFNTVNRKDTGKYVCAVSNPISNVMVMHFMTVNYGPDNVKIIGDNETVMNTPLKLSCSADSTPTASYTWMLNGSEIPNNGSEEFFKDKAEFSDSGNYTCRARNNVTGRTSSVVHALTVTEKIPQPPSSGLSGGAIAGIVIACCVVIAALLVGVFLFYRKKKSMKKSSHRNISTTTGREGKTNGAYSDEDVNYADVRFLKNKTGGRVQLESQNNSSEYAEVQVNNNRPPAGASPPTYDAHMQRTKRPAPQPGVNGVQVHDD